MKVSDITIYANPMTYLTKQTLNSACPNFKMNQNFQDKFIKIIDKYSKDGSYRQLKDYINYKYINPIIQNNTFCLTPSLILYGIDDSLLAIVEKNVLDKLQDNNTNITDMSNEVLNTEFIKNLKQQLNRNREYYKNTNKCSVIVLNNCEKILSMHVSDAENLPLQLTCNDIDELDKYNNMKNNIFFMSLLDNCHKTPEQSDGGYATTFIMTTTKPQLIYPNFNDKKTEKLHIPSPPKNEMLKIIYTHLNKKNVISKINKAGFLLSSSIISRKLTKKSFKDKYKLKTILKIIDNSNQQNSIFFLLDFFKNLYLTKPDILINMYKNNI